MNVSVQFQRHYFNVDEYYRMARAGIFAKDHRVELIKGEVIEMSPIGKHHAGCVNRLNRLLNGSVGKAAIVAVQNPISIDDFSEPQPDVALLKPRADFYSNSHPTPADVLLIIEVADTSAEYDRRVKLPLYARAGIPEAWLVVLPKDLIEAHSEPKHGKYQKVRRLKRGKTLVSTSVKELSLKVDDILG
ncbi:MAG TPA: Uma2 family endonuclease [Blastocatellia bacterium]|nr:Uma2 family endonuclease [Blastocatellia bacterium]